MSSNEPAENEWGNPPIEPDPSLKHYWEETNRSIKERTDVRREAAYATRGGALNREA